MVCALLSYLEPDFTDVPLREDQREYLCKVADGYDYISINYYACFIV